VPRTPTEHFEQLEQLDKMCQTDFQRPKIPENLPVTDRALSSDEKCLNFTSVPLIVFNQIALCLKGKFLKTRIQTGHYLSEKDQLMVFFHKCKTNNTYGVLACTFGFNGKLVSKGM